MTNPTDSLIDKLEKAKSEPRLLPTWNNAFYEAILIVKAHMGDASTRKDEGCAGKTDRRDAASAVTSSSASYLIETIAAAIHAEWQSKTEEEFTEDWKDVFDKDFFRRCAKAAIIIMGDAENRKDGEYGHGPEDCVKHPSPVNSSEKPSEQPVAVTPVIDTKLIALLEKLSCLGNGNIPGNSDGNVMAQEALEMAKNPPYLSCQPNDCPYCSNGTCRVCVSNGN